MSVTFNNQNWLTKLGFNSIMLRIKYILGENYDTMYKCSASIWCKSFIRGC